MAALVSEQEVIQMMAVFYFELLTGINPLDYLNSLENRHIPKVRCKSCQIGLRVSLDGLKFMRDCLKFDPIKKRHETLV